MLSERLQILVSPEQKRRLESEAFAQGTSVGGVIRAAVDAHYTRAPRSQRIAAVEAIRAMQAELPEDPAELERIIDAARLAEASRGVVPPGPE